MKKLTYLILGWLVSLSCWAGYQPEFSTAGFFQLEDTGREVFSMNPAWRFFKGAQAGAEQKNFDDSAWSLVSLPNGIEYLPTEASGCINYQGEIWYRKHFTLQPELKGKKLFLHFEAIMGKSKVFVNGKLLSEHFGGYLPVVVDVTDEVDWTGDNVVAVWADNQNDGLYPPGKPQETLDFTYVGGIYRDCWLVAHNPVYITDPNFENEVAGGGLVVSFANVSDEAAEVNLKLHVRNEMKQYFGGKVVFTLLQKDGKEVASAEKSFRVKRNKAQYVQQKLRVENPLLWAPADPYLYNLLVKVYNDKGEVVDGYRKRVGIRSFEFRGKEGFWLNGKPYGKPLIGANRHQDFAVVGNAVANAIHWCDAKKLKDVGLEVIRNAHCPQDPAFLDACDEFGLFVINNTPGWQYWNDAPIFAERVFEDISNLVRRDRNHACMWIWEPILNETWYPADFAKKVRTIVETEFPYANCYCASDSEARGSEHYQIHFAHPKKMYYSASKITDERTYFTREWGDNPEDWTAQNSPSRVARNWGEQPMRVQAEHYANPDYPITNFDVLFQQDAQHVGGCLWHPFDHQRGYHPDPFYGGIMDMFRQPKYSYYLFKAQRPAVKNEKLLAESGPMVFIAHEMTPFSGKDVQVYSNCDEVRLTFTKGGKTLVHKRDKERKGMPSPIITFHNVYDFMTDRNASMNENRGADIYLLAEGLIDGKVVATHKVTPARRPEKVILWLDDEGTGLHADGADFVKVVAAVADGTGRIKRLNNYYIKFELEGEGVLLGDASVHANPAPVKWGTAPVLVKSTTKVGQIKIKASVQFEGQQKPLAGELVFSSLPAAHKMIYDVQEYELMRTLERQAAANDRRADQSVQEQRKLENMQRIKEVAKQQNEFGEQM